MIFLRQWAPQKNTFMMSDLMQRYKMVLNKPSSTYSIFHYSEMPQNSVDGS
jgi:hypothetical protein